MCYVLDNLCRSSVRHADDVDVASRDLALASMARPDLAPDRLVWRAPAHADEMMMAKQSWREFAGEVAAANPAAVRAMTTRR